MADNTVAKHLGSCWSSVYIQEEAHLDLGDPMDHPFMTMLITDAPGADSVDGWKPWVG